MLTKLSSVETLWGCRTRGRSSSPCAAEVRLTHEIIQTYGRDAGTALVLRSQPPKAKAQGRCCFNAPEEGWRGSASQADPSWPLAAFLQPLSRRSHCCLKAKAEMFHSSQGSSRVVVLNSRPVHPWDGIFPLAGSGIATEKPFISLVCTSNLRGALLRLPLSAVSAVLNEAAILRPNEFEKFLTLLLQCLQ